MAAVMIGVDPHKGSHTAVAVGAAEEQLGRLRVCASAEQAQQLLAWAAAWPERTWAVEGARGLGHMLAQQLVAAGERVVDVQLKLGARVRLLAAGDTNKNDPNDARSAAIAALRSPACREVRADDHAAVLKVWSKRHRDLGRLRAQVACRLHAVLCELVPGGVRKEITAAHAARILEAAEPSGAVAIARWELASDFLQDLRRLDTQMSQTKKRLAAAVKESGTALTELFGVGPVVAAIVIAEVQDVSRFSGRTPSRPTTAPRRSRSRPGEGRYTGCRGAGTGGSTTRSTWPRSPRSGICTARAARITTRRSPRARPRKKPCALSNGASATASSGTCAPTPLPRQPSSQAREGNRGTTLTPARPDCTPNTSSSAKPLPDPNPHYARPPGPYRDNPAHAPRKRCPKPLDTKRLRYALPEPCAFNRSAALRCDIRRACRVSGQLSDQHWVSHVPDGWGQP